MVCQLIAILFGDSYRSKWSWFDAPGSASEQSIFRCVTSVYTANYIKDTFLIIIYFIEGLFLWMLFVLSRYVHTMSELGTMNSEVTLIGLDFVRYKSFIILLVQYCGHLAFSKLLKHFFRPIYQLSGLDISIKINRCILLYSLIFD